MDLKENSFRNTILMYGVEDYLIDWAVKKVKETFIDPVSEQMDFLAHDGRDVTPAEIVTSCEIFPVLSEKRVVVVKDFSLLKNSGGTTGYGIEGTDNLVEYISDPNDSAIVIFVNPDIDGRNRIVKALKKYGSAYNFEKLSEKELRSFAGKRLWDAGVKIGNRETALLINSTGYLNKESEYRLYNFENDIKKLIAYSQDGTVTEEGIGMLIDGDDDSFIFNLIDGIGENDKSAALEILYNRMKKNSYEGVSIVLAIASQVELMYEIKEFMSGHDGLSSAYAISKYMRIHKFRVEKAMRYASAYSLEKLRFMLLEIYRTYTAIVTGVMNARTALEFFIASI